MLVHYFVNASCTWTRWPCAPRNTRLYSTGPVASKQLRSEPSRLHIAVVRSWISRMARSLSLFLLSSVTLCTLDVIGNHSCDVNVVSLRESMKAVKYFTARAADYFCCWSHRRVRSVRTSTQRDVQQNVVIAPHERSPQHWTTDTYAVRQCYSSIGNLQVLSLVTEHEVKVKN